MDDLSIREGQILVGSLFNEPMRVETVRPVSSDTWSVGLVGAQSERFRSHLHVPEPVTVLGHSNAPPTRREILGMRKSMGGLVAWIGIAYLLFGLAAFMFPQLGYRPIMLAGVGLAVWVAGRSLRHVSLVQEVVDRIERNLASAARDQSKSAQVGADAERREEHEAP